ncbi:MAG: DUF1570 domain-containing protein, partial [Myxococcota bacterium]|nr:DUF1570 domain-containing protein [Myxococcota bacterium]
MKSWFSSSILCFGLLPSMAFADEVEVAQQCLEYTNLSCAQKVRDQLDAEGRTDKAYLQTKAKILFHEGKYAELEEVLSAMEYPKEDEDPSLPYRKTISASLGMVNYYRDDISIRHSDGIEVILAEEAYETLREAREQYKIIFGGVPDHDLVMDIFPTASRFIDASSIPPDAVRTTGVIALSKWNRLLLTSPRAKASGYGWKDTAAHEYIHLVVSWLTDDQTPVWLHEGLAKYFEARWRGESQNYLSVFQQSLLAKAIRDDAFVPFEKFRYSMAYLDSGEEAALAYAQVSTMVHFLQTKRGEEVFPIMMGRLRAQEDPMELMASLAGYSDFETFRSNWKTFIRELPLVQEQLKALPPALDGQGGDFADDPLLSQRTDLAKFMRIGDLLLEIKRPKAALVEFMKVDEEEGPPSPTLLHRKARCYMELNNLPKALRFAQEGVRLYPEYVDLQMILGEVQEKRGYSMESVKHWQAAHDLNPFNP